MTQDLFPSLWLIRSALAGVWLYEGLWCKLLGGQPHEYKVVEAVPYFGARIGAGILRAIGIVEVALAVWIVSGAAPLLCAAGQTILLISMNAAGVLWAHRLIADPVGMLLKNFAFVVLAWVGGALPRLL